MSQGTLIELAPATLKKPTTALQRRGAMCVELSSRTAVGEMIDVSDEP
jgi:hypothetical protein